MFTITVINCENIENIERRAVSPFSVLKNYDLVSQFYGFFSSNFIFQLEKYVFSNSKLPCSF